MFETVTVEQAIKRGQRIINLPVLLIMFGVIILSIVLGNIYTLPVWMLAIAIPACIIIPWLYWSYAITKWRIWAFENVRNVHELKKKAVEANLIWPDGSFFERTEIKSYEDKSKLENLNIKFAKPDIFEDDFATPEETIVKYSKVKAFTSLIIGLGLLGLSAYLLEVKTYFGAVFVLIMGGVLCFTGFKHVLNTQAQIILNSKGIETFRTSFQPWSAILNEEIIKEGSGKSTRYYFTYSYIGGFEKIQIGEFDLNRKQLEHLLHVYRVRSTKSKNSIINY